MSFLLFDSHLLFKKVMFNLQSTSRSDKVCKVCEAALDYWYLLRWLRGSSLRRCFAGDWCIRLGCNDCGWSLGILYQSLRGTYSKWYRKSSRKSASSRCVWFERIEVWGRLHPFAPHPALYPVSRSDGLWIAHSRFSSPSYVLSLLLCIILLCILLLYTLLLWTLLLCTLLLCTLLLWNLLLWAPFALLEVTFISSSLRTTSCALRLTRSRSGKNTSCALRLTGSGSRKNTSYALRLTGSGSGKNFTCLDLNEPKY